MSAYFAVAVMNCSCTRRNRSSRARPRATAAAVGRDVGGVGVLHQHRRDRRAAGQRVRLAAQHRADARLVHDARRGIDQVEAVRLGEIEAPVVQVQEEGAAALCCQAPVIAGRQVTACMAAAPLRERVKPKPSRRKLRSVRP